MTETLVARRDMVRKHMDDASKAFLRPSPQGYLDALRELCWALDDVELAIRETIQTARDPQGTNDQPATWEQIGGALFVTKQAAQKRYGPLI